MTRKRREKSSRNKLTATQREVVREIKRLYRRNEPLNITAVKRNQPALIRNAYAVKPFWGWKSALEDAGISYNEINVDLREYVVCRICGYESASLNRHLGSAHGTDLEEYRWDYPNAEVVCEATRAKMSRLTGSCRRWRFRHGVEQHWEPLWTPEYVLDRAYHAFLLAGRPLNYKNVREHEGSSLDKKAIQFFHSWDNVLRRIGLDPEDIRLCAPCREWTREVVIEELLARHRAGSALNSSSLFEEYPALAQAAQAFFGSVYDAVVGAGLDTEGVGRKNPRYTQADRTRLLRAIRAVAISDMEGLDLRKAVIRLQQQYAPVVKTFYVGGWAKAANDAGVDVRRIRRRHRTYWSGLEVIREIRRRKRCGEGIHRAALCGEYFDVTLPRWAKTYFGSWNKALEAAGFDPMKVCRRHPNKYRSAEAVLSEIRRRRRLNMPLSHNVVAKKPGEDHALYHAARSEFGTWRAAVEAAGFDYADITLVKNPYPTPKAVVREIGRRRRSGIPVNSVAIQKGQQRDCALVGMARHYFGSWRAAVEAAGFDYSDIALRKNPYPTAAAVVREIKRRARLELPIHCNGVCAGEARDSALYAKAWKHFGSWGVAVEAAGIDYTKVVRRRTPKGKGRRRCKA